MSLSAMRCPACSMVAPPSMKTAGPEVRLAHAGAEHALHALRPVRVGEGARASRRSRSRRRRRRRGCGRSAPAPPACGTRKQSVSSAAMKSSPAAPWTRARLSKLSFGPSTAFSTPSSRASTEPLMTTCRRLGGAAPRQDGLARPEIADVERGAEFLDLLLAQAVEGRVVRVEAALHGGRARARAGSSGPARAAPVRQWTCAEAAPMPVSDRTYCAS